MVAEEKVLDREAQLKLDMRRLEVKDEKAVRLRELELVSQRETPWHGVVNVAPSTSLSSGSLSSPGFDISKHFSLVPIFRETEVDSYFAAFECIACALCWPRDVWPLLLQCRIQGKAQDAVAALPVEESLNYELVKTAILCAYDLVQEAYRQKFRNHEKLLSQSYAEFEREIDFLLGNDIAGGKVTPSLEVLDAPHRTAPGRAEEVRRYPACMVTRAHAKKKAKKIQLKIKNCPCVIEAEGEGVSVTRNDCAR